MRKQPVYYEPSFKQAVVNEVIYGGHKIADVGKKMGLHIQLISRWVAEARAGKGWARNQAQVAQDQETLKLQREVKRLKMENEILKKASAYFRICLLYTSPSPRDRQKSRMPSSA